MATASPAHIRLEMTPSGRRQALVDFLSDVGLSVVAAQPPWEISELSDIKHSFPLFPVVSPGEHNK